MATELTNEPDSFAEQPNANEVRRLTIFADRMFARLPAALSEAYPPARRTAIAAEGLEFFAVRDEPIKVRAFGCDADPSAVTVETVMPDCPFIVDSIREYFRGRDRAVHALLHPLFQLQRNAGGALLSFEQGAGAERPESFTHAELAIPATSANCRALERDLLRILTQVRDATGDFAAMTARTLQICEETAAQRELVEVRDFLRWLVQSGFVFLGYRRYRIEPVDGRVAILADGGSSLGIMRNETGSRFLRPTPLGTLEEGLRKLLFDGPVLIIGKTRAEAEVHRRALMDDITLRRIDAKGQPIGFDRFIGLFTSKAYSEEAEHIPVLRAKLREEIGRASCRERVCVPV